MKKTTKGKTPKRIRVECTERLFLNQIEEHEAAGYVPLWETHKRYAHLATFDEYIIMEKKKNG